MRALNARGSAGRHLRLDGFCQRRAASPPSGHASAGRHLSLGSFCQRRAASPPSSVSVPVAGRLLLRPPGLLPLAVTCAWVVSVSGGLHLRPRASRPSPSHRYAAGPSLYKRGCLRLRNSPAASRHYALRPLSLLMPGSGHARLPLHPASLCPPGPFSQFSVPRKAFSRPPGPFLPSSVPIGQRVRDISLETLLTGGGLTGRQN